MIGNCGNAGSAPVAVPIIKNVPSLPPCNGTGDFLYRITSVTEIGGAPISSPLFFQWSSCQGTAWNLIYAGSSDTCAFCVAGSTQVLFSRDVNVTFTAYSNATQGCSTCNGMAVEFIDHPSNTGGYSQSSFFVNNTNNCVRLKIGYFDADTSSTFLEFSSWDGFNSTIYSVSVNLNCWINVAPNSIVYQWKESGDILEVVSDVGCGCYPPQIFENQLPILNVGQTI